MKDSFQWRLAFGLSLCAAILLLSAFATVQKEQQPKLLLEEATKKELIDGDLKGAIETYQRILNLEGVPRAVVAKALLHLGQCNEKLGNAEARKAYERLVREFADQPEEAKLARARLEALGGRNSVMATRRVWAGPSVDTSGALSRDGAYLTFSGPSEDLAIHDFATGQNRQLTKHPGVGEFVYSSVPSPDGKQVAYSWYNADDFCDLRIVGLDGSEPRVLYRNAEVSWLYPTDWSPDGKNILAILPRKEGDQVVLVSVVDGSLRALKTIQADFMERLRFSPDGRYIAYDSPQRPGSLERDVFLIALDTGREIPLIQHPANDSVLDWTPDGKGILFRSDRSGTMGAWLMQVAGGRAQGTPELVKPDLGSNFKPMGFSAKGSYYYAVGTVRSDVYVAELDLASGKVLVPPALATQRFIGSNEKPDWSRDGRALIFLSRLGSAGEWDIRALCVRSTDSGEVRELPLKLNRIGWIRWFPDGQSLLASGHPPNEFGIYRINVQTGESILVSDLSLGWPVIFSPDGKTIFRYRYNQAAKSSSIMERDLETGRERELHSVNSPSLYQSSIALSPDGRQLAFVVGEGESQSKVLKVIPVEGGAARDLLRETPPLWRRTVAWAQDGLSLLFARSAGPDDSRAELWLISSRGGEPRKLQLAAEDLSDLCVHPDGRHIAFTSAQNKNEIWVMENFLPGPK
jgi:Tol biopolymer transport system component